MRIYYGKLKKIRIKTMGVHRMKKMGMIIHEAIYAIREYKK